MKLTDSLREIRRLSNSSDHARNPYFPAELKVYWKDMDKWIKYKEVRESKAIKLVEKSCDCILDAIQSKN